MTSNTTAAGVVVAVIGPDAAGKTAIAAGLSEALGAQRRVISMHLGTPPETLASRPLRLASRVLHRLSATDAGQSSRTGRAALYLRALALAVSRRAAVGRAHKLAVRGLLVITDRYPGREPGSASGPSIAPAATSRLGGALARLERSLYRRMPPPHVVVRVRVPVDECMRRNATRATPKAEATIRASHRAAELVRFPGVAELDADNTRPLAAVIAGLSADLVGYVERRSA